ncbi:helix-turn-helix domain-containing protein [Alkalihalobacillus deserti]|nr:helix-turn-helix domain-containing protein [Alkalihalobacillus deserti]
MNKTIGCSRFVFNFFLGKQKDKDAIKPPIGHVSYPMP